MTDVTELFAALHRAQQEGDHQRSELVDALLDAVYDELRGLARARLAREAPGHTLQATALVHEAWMRLVGGESRPFQDRAYFFSAAAESMRRILVERARAAGRWKRGGDRQRVELEDQAAATEHNPIDILALDEALAALGREDERKARLVELRYFAGLTVEQAADVLGISRATAERDWAYSKAFLYQALRDADDRSSEGT